MYNSLFTRATLVYTGFQVFMGGGGGESRTPCKEVNFYTGFHATFLGGGGADSEHPVKK